MIFHLVCFPSRRQVKKYKFILAARNYAGSFFMQRQTAFHGTGRVRQKCPHPFLANSAVVSIN